MQIGESDTGGIYWFCESKDYSRKANQQYPSDGILRCHCGAPYKFEMKNQPRWVCTADPKHYQIMREGDLKLPKMLALIPTKKALKEVEKYFKDKRAASGKAHPLKKPTAKTPSPKKPGAKNAALQPEEADQISLFDIKN